VEVIVERDQLGEEADADLVEWLVPDGAVVEVGQPVAELSTAKVILQISAPAAGTLKHLKGVGSMVEAGMAIGRIDVT